MAAAAAKAAGRALLKVKLGGDERAATARIAAVRAAAPQAALIVDANEGWNDENLAANLAACATAGVALVEQPLPDGARSMRLRPSNARFPSAPTRAFMTDRRYRRSPANTTRSISSSTRPAA